MDGHGIRQAWRGQRRHAGRLYRHQGSRQRAMAPLPQGQRRAALGARSPAVPDCNRVLLADRMAGFTELVAIHPSQLYGWRSAALHAFGGQRRRRPCRRSSAPAKMKSPSTDASASASILSSSPARSLRWRSRVSPPATRRQRMFLALDAPTGKTRTGIAQSPQGLDTKVIPDNTETRAPANPAMMSQASSWSTEKSSAVQPKISNDPPFEVMKTEADRGASGRGSAQR